MIIALLALLIPVYAGIATCDFEPLSEPALSDLTMVQQQLDWVEQAPNSVCSKTVLTPKLETTASLWKIHADQMSFDQALGYAHDVVISNGRYHITASNACITYDASRKMQSVSLNDKVSFDMHLLHLQAQQATLDPSNSTAHIQNSAFAIHFDDKQQSGIIWGRAHDALLSEDYSTLQTVEITACQPERIAWSIQAQSAHWDAMAKSLTVFNPTILLADIPILSFPYITFSNARQSGLLRPVINFSLGSSGDWSYGQPIYYNWLPNQDIIVTPFYQDKRKARFDFIYRGLYGDNRFLFAGQWLPNDRLFESNMAKMSYDANNATEVSLFNKQTGHGHNRYHMLFKYDGILDNHWQLAMQWRKMSDAYFLEDFKKKLYPTSLPGFQDMLVQSDVKDFQYENFIRLSGQYSLTEWLIESQRFHELMTLKRYHIDDLYSRFVNISMKHRLNDYWSSDFNLTRFGISSGIIQSTSDDSKGWRLHIRPKYEFNYGFLDFWKSLNILNFLTKKNGISSNQSKVIPQLGIGMNIPISDQSRILVDYHYTPYVEQAGIPDFEASLKYFDFKTLHDADRFEGLDRVGDVSQVNFETQIGLDNAIKLRFGQRIALRKNRFCLGGDCQGDWLAKYHMSPVLMNVDWALNDSININIDGNYHFLSHAWVNRQLSFGYSKPDVNLALNYKIRKDALMNDPLLHKAFMYKERILGIEGFVQFNQAMGMQGKFQKKVEGNHFLEYELKLSYHDCCWLAEFVVGRSSDGDIKTKQAFKNHRYELRLDIPKLFDAVI